MLIPIGFFGGGSAYWISSLDSGTDDSFSNAFVDANNNIFALGNYTTGGVLQARLTKMNESGSVLWERTLYTGTDSSVFNEIATDSSGNLFIAGRHNASSRGDASISKYDSTGTFQWYKGWNKGSYSDYFSAIQVDSSGNIYAAGSYMPNSVSAGVLLVKANSSGTLSQIKGSGYVVYSYYGVGKITLYGSNLYTVGTMRNDPYSVNNFFITKHSSSTMNPVWQQWANFNNHCSFNDFVIDSSENIYVAGARTMSSGRGLLMKFDSSGSVLWQKYITLPDSGGFSSITRDPATGDLYVAGYTYPGVVIIKFDSSGTILWERRLTHTGNIGIGSVSMFKDDGILLTGTTYTSGDYEAVNIYYPKDGSILGTFGDFTFSASSSSIATDSISPSSNSVFGDSSTTLQSRTPTSASISSTNTIIEM